MKRYIVFIKNKQDSEYLQRELFKLGYYWIYRQSNKYNSVIYTEAEFIYIHFYSDNIYKLCYSQTPAIVMNRINNEGIIPIDSTKLLTLLIKG